MLKEQFCWISDLNYYYNGSESGRVCPQWVSEWVCRFLTAHQHIKGLSTPHPIKTGEADLIVPQNFVYERQKYSSVIFVNENENENGEKRENNEFVNEN